MYKIFGISMMKQVNMRQMLLALLPLLFLGIGFFGWRVLVLFFVNSLAGLITEYLFKRKTKKPVSEAVFVTTTLYTLIIPASTPFWVGVVGIVFALVFAKEAFGGFGRNVFNPALVARAFVYVSFPASLTGSWTKVSSSFFGGFSKWLGEGIDVIAQATPMLRFQDNGALENLSSLFWGQVAGSIGEVSKVAILLALGYLILKKVVFVENIISMILGFSVMTLIFKLAGVSSTLPVHYGLLSGGFLFAAAFMITDPITSAKTKWGRWIYGLLVGAVTVLIRSFAIFPGGVMFAILIGNMFVPIIDEAVKALVKRRKAA